MDLRCKYCGSSAVVKFGRYKDIQLHFCKLCGRKFRAKGSPFHMKLPAEVIATALEMHYTGRRLKHVRSFLGENFGYYPSKTVLYYWVEKFTNEAIRYFGSFCPVVGDSWMLDESVVMTEGQHDVWIYDIIDEKTRYLLSSHAVLVYSAGGVRSAIDEAIRRARRVPARIIVRKKYGFGDSPEQIIPPEINYSVQQPAINDLNDFELIERFSGTLVNGARAIRSFRNTRTLVRYIKGWWVYYNYFKPRLFISGQTPAEAAGINYEIKSWLDFVKFRKG